MRVKEGIAKCILIGAMRSAMDHYNERVFLASQIIVWIVEDALDLLVLSSFPTHQLRFGERFLQKARVKFRDCLRILNMGSIKLRPKPLGRQARGRISIEQRFAIR